MKGIRTQSNTLNKNSTPLPSHNFLIKTRTSIVVAPRLLKPMDHPWWVLLLALFSSTCHPQWMTCTHEHATMTLVHVTHSEWHVCTSTQLWLQYMLPTTSDCTHEHTTMTLVHATHSNWHVRTSTLLWLQYMPPTTSDMYTKAWH